MKRSTFLTAAVILVVIVVAYLILAPVRLDPALVDQLTGLSATHQQSITKPERVVIIDYDLPIYKKRLWVIEVETGKTVLLAHVSHAWRSGLVYATDFSNETGTEQSCVGAFVTGESYNGEFGYAMRLTGLDSGINDRAFPRAIVCHESYWPWSKGCFMTLPDVNRRLIDLVKGGSLFYVHESE